MLRFSGASGDLFTRARGSEAGWVSLAALAGGEAELTGGLETRDSGSEGTRVGGSRSWGRWGVAWPGGEVGLVSGLGLSMSVSSLLHALARSSSGLLSEGELV